MTFLSSILTASFLFVSSAQADSKAVYLEQIGPKNLLLDNESSQYSLSNIRITKVPTIIEHTECDYSDEFCPSKALDQIHVVQARFTYYDPTALGDDKSETVQVNFDLKDFTQDELSGIRATSNYVLDPFGRKGRANRSLANKLIYFSVETVVKPVGTIDYEKSKICDGDDFNSDCDDEYVYKTINRKFKSVTFKKK